MKSYERWESDWSQDRIDRMWGAVLKREEWKTNFRYTIPTKFAFWNAKSILDIGCGGGILYKAISELPTDIYYEGIDITPKMISCARRLFPDATFRIGDATNLPYTDGSFDLCVVAHVIEHQPPNRAKQIISEAMSVARRAVILIFFIPPSNVREEQIKIAKDHEGFFANVYNHGWIMEIICSTDKNCSIERKRYKTEKEDNTFYIIKKT